MKYFLLILLLSCAPVKDIQVKREMLELVSIEEQHREGKTVTLLQWRNSNGDEYFEYSHYPCFLKIGSRQLILVRR